MSHTEKRRESLINIAYFTVLIVAFYLFMKYAFGLLWPFIFAAAVATLLQRPVNAISTKTHIKKGFVSVAMLLVFIILVVSIIGLAGYKVFNEFREFAAFAGSWFKDVPNLIKRIEEWLLGVITVLPDSIEKTAREAIGDFADRLLDYLAGESGGSLTDALGFSFPGLSETIGSATGHIADIASPILSTAMALPGKLVGVLIFFIASFFLTSDYDTIVSGIKKNMKAENAAKLSTVKRITFSSLGKMAKSYILIICITFCELVIGLNLLKLFHLYDGGYILIISVCTAMLDILPVFGTGTVMVPWALYNLLFAHNVGLGIGLLILYALITVIRQVLEPKLVGANLGLHPILTLAGMYVGLETLGVIGMLTLPITIVIIKMLNEDGVIHLWGETRELKTESDLPAQEPILKPAVQKIAQAVKTSGRQTGKKSAKKSPEGENKQKK